MIDGLEERLITAIGLSGRSRKIRDNSQENIAYSEDIKGLIGVVREAIGSGDPHQNLMAEKYCIIFQRNFCTANENERGKLNDQLMKLGDAQIFVDLVKQPEKYREFTESTSTEIQEGRLPYHGCAVFVKTQIDTLNKSGQGTGIEAEKELWQLRKENLRDCRNSFEVLQEKALFMQDQEQDMGASRDAPNMAEVQAAESKASMIQSLDKSADGMSVVEGKDVGYIEEGYMMAANDVKYEAQQARTANAEAQTQGFKIGDRVTFKTGNVTVTGTVKGEDADSVTLECGSMTLPIAKGKGTFSKAPSAAKESSKEYAKDLAMKSLGPEGKVLLARNKGTYTGPVIGMTSTFAIQKVNENTAVLHRLKDLQTQDKDAQGLIKEGEDLTIVKDATGVSISRTEARDRDNDKVRTQQKTRGSMSR